MKQEILYIYKKGSPVGRANSVSGEMMFISDGQDFTTDLPGLIFRGVIFSGDARVSRGNLAYLMTRLRLNDPRGPVYVIDDYHSKELIEMFEEYYDISDNDEYKDSIIRSALELGLPLADSTLGL